MLTNRSLKVALSSSSWLQAMEDEYRALLQNRTWSLTSLPSGAKVVGYKWIFKTSSVRMTRFNDIKHG